LHQALKKLEHLLFAARRVSRWLVDLVDHHDWLSPNSKDFLSTKRVCGIGPSWASTTRSTESIERSTRSTSLPKVGVDRAYQQY